MYVYMHTYMHIHKRLCLCICIYMDIGVCSCSCRCVHINVHVLSYLHMYTAVHRCMCSKPALGSGVDNLIMHADIDGCLFSLGGSFLVGVLRKGSTI